MAVVMGVRFLPAFRPARLANGRRLRRTFGKEAAFVCREPVIGPVRRPAVARVAWILPGR